MKLRHVISAAIVVLSAMQFAALADVRLPTMFSDHAVLQRDMKLPVWGWADPGEDVTVMLAGQTQKAKADDKGKWRVTFEPLAAGGPHELTVEGKNRLAVKDILVGEVWLCSGQSNMEFPVSAASNSELEVSGANYPNIRLVRVKEPGAQAPVETFDGGWKVCTPETVGEFSAVGYVFGRELGQQLNVPIGLIDNSWGGSSCEAWIRRDRLEGNPLYAPLLAKWDKMVANWDQAKWEADTAAWRKKAAEAKAKGEPTPPNKPLAVEPMTGNHRPANLYNARVMPVLPYAIRGTIWYQGESNAGRAYQYREMFPLMIKSWREDWGQGDFPFYFVQLADFMAEKPEPADSSWAELREAQTMTLDKSPNTGEAVIIDIGEAADIHPRNKFEVARRLARLALARDYGRKIVSESPRYTSMEKKDDTIILKFKDVAGGLQTRDAAVVEGFTIAGDNKQFVKAEAKILGPDTIAVRSFAVPNPAAVRYAWADNPVCNVYNSSLLPLTPFRTDDWPGITVNNKE